MPESKSFRVPREGELTVTVAGEPFAFALDAGAEVDVEWQPIATDGGDVTPRDLVEPTADTLRDRRNAVKSILAGREQPQHVERYLEGYYDALNLAVDEVFQAADRELLGEPICRDPDAHDAVYDPRNVEDDGVSRKLRNLLSEACNENYGNVRAVAESLAEYLEDAHKDEVNADGGDA